MSGIATEGAVAAPIVVGAPNDPHAFPDEALLSSDDGRVPLPATVDRKRIRWGTLGVILGVHVLALGVFVPAFFSWSGVAAAFVAFYLFGTLGINVCYHRLLTHRSFKTPKWFERTLALLGACNLQGSPAKWVAAHRMHHQDADDQPDPHTPLVNFLWGHIGWLVVENGRLSRFQEWERFARDLLKDPFYAFLQKGDRWFGFALAHIAVFFLLGFGVGLLTRPDAASAAMLGVSWLVWGVFFRLVAVWHITWCVNSVTHLWGYRNYETNENSRNNWLIGILATGEGWHNNHHADQRSAAHGHRWWEIDISYWTIRAFALVGLAKDIVRPNHERLAAKSG